MSLRLGITTSGRPVYLPEDARATHVHMVGATGTGKSKELELMIRQDIKEGRGLCLIDPNAALYQATVQWMAATGYGDMRRVHLLNPHMHDWGFAFNPLQGDADPAVVVDAALSACVQAFGGEDMDAKPRLSRILRLLLSALLYGGLTMAESVQLLEARSGKNLREHLALESRDPVVAAGLRDLTRLDEREFTLQTESTLNRFSAFIAPPLVRRIVGQSHGIDFRRVMDQGDIILLNLNPGAGMSEQNAKLLGTLFVNSLFAAARLRPEGSRPFYVYIDECYRFLTQDVERILDEGRKYGIHLILAHQRLGQLQAAGDHIFSAVMTNARTKIVFGGLTPDDAALMEAFLYMGTYDLEKLKARITSPTTVAHDLVWLQSTSRSRGSSETHTESWGTSESTTESLTDMISESLGRSVSTSDGDSSGTSASETYDPEDEEQEAYVASRGSSQSRSRSSSRGTSQSSSTATGRSSSRGSATSHGTSYGISVSDSHSQGRSQTFKPILEERSTTTWSLDEQRYLQAAAIRNLPKRHAILRIPDQPAQSFTTDTVTSPITTPARIRAFNAHALTKSPYTRPLPEIDQELALRQSRLSAQVEATLLPEEPVSFREKKRTRAKVIEG